MGVVSIGVDIGQKRDPTAIAVVERDERKAGDGRSAVHHLVRHLERLPLDTAYPAVAERIAAVQTGTLEQAGTLKVSIDATGVGQPIVDLMTAAGVLVSAVYFTHGDRRTTNADGTISLGKAWLVSQMQVLLQSHRLHLPTTREAEALAKELLDYEIKISEDANDRYGAFRVGAHDDLVTAVGLAVQAEITAGLSWDALRGLVGGRAIKNRWFHPDS